MTETKKILNQMLGHPDGAEKQAALRGMLLILYFGEDEFDFEDDESIFFLMRRIGIWTGLKKSDQSLRN